MYLWRCQRSFIDVPLTLKTGRELGHRVQPHASSLAILTRPAETDAKVVEDVGLVASDETALLLVRSTTNRSAAGS